MKKSEKYFLEKTRSKVTRAIEDFSLFQEKDRLLIGISGGKDSMALLDILANRKKALSFSFDIKAVHIQLTDIPYYTDAEYLNNFCKEREIEFELISSDKKIVQEDKQACFYCAWNRRRLLFDHAVNHNFNKVVLGHHKDDAVETLLMNMVYHGEFSSFPVKISMFDGHFDIIRPLIYLTDKELQRYIRLIEYTPLPYDCEFAATNKREDLKKFIHELKQIHPNAVNNIFKAMNNINKKHLPVKEKKPS